MVFQQINYAKETRSLRSHLIAGKLNTYYEVTLHQTQPIWLGIYGGLGFRSIIKCE
jgi:hypothetical protein